MLSETVRLRYKSKGYQLAVFDRETGKSYPANVKDVGCQNYFNRIEVSGMDPDEFEKAMSEFETNLADALKRMLDVANKNRGGRK